MVLFAAGAAIAWRHLPEDVHLARWELVLVLAGVLTPATLLLNAVRFGLSARLLGRRVPARTAFQVSVLASAANLLPLPGAALVRVQGLKEMGEGYRSAISATGVLAAAGLGITGLAAGGLQWAGGSAALGGVLCGVGAVALAVMGWLLVTTVEAGRRAGLLARVLALELGVVAVLGLRLWLALLALGVDASWTQAVVLTLAPLAASAVGVLPDGIGLREAAAAGLATLVALPASVGYLASALDRVVAMTVMVPVALVLARSVERTRGS